MYPSLKPAPFIFLGRDIAPLLQTQLLARYVIGVMAGASESGFPAAEGVAVACLQSSAPGVIGIVCQKLLALPKQHLVEQGATALSGLLSCPAHEIKMAALEALERLSQRQFAWHWEFRHKLSSALIGMAASDTTMERKPGVERAIVVYLRMLARWKSADCRVFAANLPSLLYVASRGSRTLQGKIFTAIGSYTQQCTEAVAELEKHKILLNLMGILLHSVSRNAGRVLPLVTSILQKYTVKTDHIFTRAFLKKFTSVLVQLPASHAGHVVAIARAIFDCPRATIERALAANVPAGLVQYLGEHIQEQAEFMDYMAAKARQNAIEAGADCSTKRSLLPCSLGTVAPTGMANALPASDGDILPGLEREFALLVERAQPQATHFGFLECDLVEFNLGRLEEQLLVKLDYELKFCLTHPSSKEARMSGLEGVMTLCQIAPEFGRRLYEREVLAVILQTLGSEAANADADMVCACVSAFDAVMSSVGREAIAASPYTKLFFPFALGLMEVAQTPESHLIFLPLLSVIRQIVSAETGRLEMPVEALLDGLLVLMDHGNPAVSMLALWCAGRMAAGEARLLGRCINARAMDVIKAMLGTGKYREHGLAMFAGAASGDAEKARLVLDSGLLQAVLVELGCSRLDLVEMRFLLTGLCYMTRAEVASVEGLLLFCEMGLEALVVAALKRGQHLGLVLYIIYNVLLRMPPHSRCFKSSELTEGLKRVAPQYSLARSILAKYLEA